MELIQRLGLSAGALRSQLREARAAPRAGGGPEDQYRVGAARAARGRPGTWGIRGPSGDPAVAAAGVAVPASTTTQPEHTALLNLLPAPRRPTAEDGKTPGFPRSETQPSRPRGMAPLSTVFSLLSSVTAREDTKGPDLVGPPGRRRGPGDWRNWLRGEAGQRWRPVSKLLGTWEGWVEASHTCPLLPGAQRPLG